MAGVYSLSLRTTVTTIAAASWCAISPSTNRATFYEYSWINGAATASVVGVARSANTPTLTSGVAFLGEDSADVTALTQASSTFGTAPTVPPQFNRRWSIAGTIGVGIVQTWPRGFVLAAAGAGLVTWNITANSAVVDVNATIVE